MSNAYTTENLKNIFTFPFKDERWKEKLFVAVGLSLLGFLLLPYFFVGGYMYEIMRRIIVDRENPSLPVWDDWGTYFTNGFKLFALSLIYSLPAMILMLGAQLIFVFFMGTTETGGSGQEIFPLIGMPIFYGAMGVGTILMLISSQLMLVGQGHMIANDEFGAAFRFKEMWAIYRKNFIGYLIAFVIIMGLSYMVSMVASVLMFTIVLCCLYPVVMFIATIYMGLIGSVLFAQAYIEGVEKVTEDSIAAAELIEEAIEESKEEEKEE